MNSLLFRFLAPVAMTLALFSCQAAAVTKNWTPFFGGNSWQGTLNWDPNGVPTSSDDVVIGVANDLVVLNDDTAFIDSLDLRNGADLRTNGHTLVVQGHAEIGNGTNLSRLEVDPTAGKSVDVDLLEIKDGGQLDMDGGLVEVDVQFVMQPGSQLFGHGRLEMIGNSNLALGGMVVVPIAEKLTLESTSTMDFFFRDADIVLQPSATLELVANGYEPSTGDIFLANDAAFDVNGPWELQGTLGMTGSISTLEDESFVRGGAITVSGDLSLTDNAHLQFETPVAFNSMASFSSGGSLQVGFLGRVILNQPSTMAGGTYQGVGQLIARAGLVIEEDTTINTRTVDFRHSSPFATGLTIEPGRTLTLGNQVRNFQQSEISGAELPNQANLLIGAGAMLDVGRDWESTSQIELDNNATIAGNEITQQGAFHLGGNSAVITAPIQFNDNFGGQANITGSGTLRIDGDATYHGTLVSQFAGDEVTVLQDGDVSIRDLDTEVDIELWAIAGSPGSVTDVDFSISAQLTTNDVTVAAGANSQADIMLGDGNRWDVEESFYLGGSQSQVGGTATMTLSGSSSTSLIVDDLLKIYPGSTLDVRIGTVDTENLIVEPGGQLLLGDVSGRGDRPFWVGRTGAKLRHGRLGRIRNDPAVQRAGRRRRRSSISMDHRRLDGRSRAN